jgi:hypothetical protein
VKAGSTIKRGCRSVFLFIFIFAILWLWKGCGDYDAVTQDTLLPINKAQKMGIKLFYDNIQLWRDF